MIKNFGKVQLSQLLFHIRVGAGGGLTKKLIISGVKYGVQWIIIAGFLTYLLFIFLKSDSIGEIYSLLKNGIKKLASKLNKPLLILGIILAAISVKAFSFVDHNLHVVKYLTQKQSPFFEKNYARLDTTHFKNPKKKNLIIIFLESMEQGYSDKNIYGENLIKELNELQKEGIVFKGHKNSNGANFTIGGIAAQTLGVPIVRVPFDIHDGKTRFNVLLKNAPSIFNLLKNDGYSTTAFFGTSQKFTAQDNFLQVHGIADVYSREYFETHNYLLDEENRGADSWGYNDEFLWARFCEYLSNISRSNQPFAAMLETIDTHFPKGFTKKKFEKFNGVQDAIRASSIMVSEFISWAKKQPWYKNTTIVIVGDHPWQDPPVDFTQLTKKSHNREIFNVILNSVYSPKTITISDGWSSNDMASTILDAMGIEYAATLNDGKVVKHRVGIGKSLFFNQKTLMGELGQDNFMKTMNKPSRFYDRLY